MQQKPRRVAESRMELALSAAAETGAPAKGPETSKRAAQQHENNPLLLLAEPSHALIGADAPAPAHRKTPASLWIVSFTLFLSSIGILRGSLSTSSPRSASTPLPSGSEEVASARYDRLGLEAPGGEGVAPPPSPSLPPRPFPLAAPKCYQHFCEDINQDCCAPGDEAAVCREVFVFRPPTHFSHMSHPTFPISHRLFLFF